MPDLPYPEFNDFHLVLNQKVVHNDGQAEGHAFLSVNSQANCVRDILIALRCCFRYRTDDGTTHTVLLHEEIQRNATPFDDIGVPQGDYEFPFSFTIPAQLPPSVVATGGWDSLNNCKIWYEIRAYVMHTENHPTMERKHLRTSVKFQRCVSHIDPNDHSQPVPQKIEHNFNHVYVCVELDKSVYVHGEPIKVKLNVRNELLRSVSSIKVSCKQHIVIRKRSMRQVKEFIIKQVVAAHDIKSGGVPVKRNQTYSDEVVLIPKYCHELAQNSYGGVALAGVLEQETPGQLSSSVVRHTPEGIEVSYTVEVHLCVMLAADMVVTVPFVLSDPLPAQSNRLPSYWEEAQRQSTVLPQSVDESDVGDDAGHLPSYDETIQKSSVYKVMQPSSGGNTEPSNEAGPSTSDPPADNDATLTALQHSQSLDVTGQQGRRRPIIMSMNRQSAGAGTDQLNHRSLNVNKEWRHTAATNAISPDQRPIDDGGAVSRGGSTLTMTGEEAEPMTSEEMPPTFEGGAGDDDKPVAIDG